MILVINITIIDKSIEIINSDKTKLLEMNIDCKVKFAHELQINVNQKLISFKFQTLLLLSFL